MAHLHLPPPPRSEREVAAPAARLVSGALEAGLEALEEVEEVAAASAFDAASEAFDLAFEAATVYAPAEAPLLGTGVITRETAPLLSVRMRREREGRDAPVGMVREIAGDRAGDHVRMARQQP